LFKRNLTKYSPRFVGSKQQISAGHRAPVDPCEDGGGMPDARLTRW
jgi:hypothetical protein